MIDTRVGSEDGWQRVRPLRQALGVRRRRLRHHHLHAKAEDQAVLRTAREAWVEEGPEAGELIVVDEATRRRQPPLTAQWGLVDAGPAVPTGDAHPQGQVDGAVAPLPGRIHDLLSPNVAKAEVATCLPPLVAADPGVPGAMEHKTTLRAGLKPQHAGGLKGKV